MLLIKVSYKGRKQTSALQREIQDHYLLHWDEVSQLLRQLSDDAFKFLIYFKVADPLNVGRELDECFNIFHNVLGISSLKVMDEVFEELSRWGYIKLDADEKKPGQEMTAEEKVVSNDFYRNRYFREQYKRDTRKSEMTGKMNSPATNERQPLPDGKWLSIPVTLSDKFFNQVTSVYAVNQSASPELTRLETKLLGYLQFLAPDNEDVALCIVELAQIFKVSQDEINQAILRLFKTDRLSLDIVKALVRVN